VAGGSPGSCKICQSPYADIFNRMILEGKDQGKIRDTLREFAPEFTWSRPTYYDHKRHITHPIVTAVQAAREYPLVVPQTNRGALEMIRDVGMKRVIDRPDDITPDHALKAIGLMEASKRRPIESVFILMAKEMTSRPQDDVIEGEYRELLEEE